MGEFEKTIARLKARSGVQSKKPRITKPPNASGGPWVYHLHALYKKLYGQLSNPPPSASAYAPPVMVPVRAAGPRAALRKIRTKARMGNRRDFDNINHHKLAPFLDAKLRDP
uniref:Uncharacterized protein n=1 Tax=Pleurozia purpurea TaxID=280637 RepID=D0R020_9MARC|nr:hypothetical protein PlpuMp21 [Pleurozia purpurea]ACR19357.1 hypothetical protein PlpuMp21 [Pleurozia purpurea]